MGKGSKPKLAPPPAPVATPTPLTPEILRKGEDRRRRLAAAASRSGTILTGMSSQSGVSLLGQTV